MYGKIKNRTKKRQMGRQQQHELQMCFDYKVKLHANYNPFVFLKQGIMKKSHKREKILEGEKIGRTCI